MKLLDWLLCHWQPINSVLRSSSCIYVLELLKMYFLSNTLDMLHKKFNLAKARSMSHVKSTHHSEITSKESILKRGAIWYNILS